MFIFVDFFSPTVFEMILVSNTVASEGTSKGATPVVSDRLPLVDDVAVLPAVEAVAFLRLLFAFASVSSPTSEPMCMRQMEQRGRGLRQCQQIVCLPPPACIEVPQPAPAPDATAATAIAVAAVGVAAGEGMGVEVGSSTVPRTTPPRRQPQ